MFWNKQPWKWGPNLFLQHSEWYFNTQYGDNRFKCHTIIRTPQNKTNSHNSTVRYMCSMSSKYILQHATYMNSHFHLLHINIVNYCSYMFQPQDEANFRHLQTSQMYKAYTCKWSYKNGKTITTYVPICNTGCVFKGSLPQFGERNTWNDICC